MTNHIIYDGNFRYEIHKNGLFWKAYIYKNDRTSNYNLINTFRTLVKPDIKMIIENIEEISTEKNVIPQIIH